MLIQYNKASSGVVKNGDIIAPRKKTYVINGDFNKGIGGWTVVSGAADASDGNMRVWALSSDGNVVQHLTNRLQPGWIYQISVQQLAGTGNGQWHIESAQGAGDIFNSNGFEGVQTMVLPVQSGDTIWIRLKAIFGTSTSYQDFGYVRIKQLEPV